MTRLTASIRGATVADLEAHASRAWERGAEAVELRVDTFADPPEKLRTFLTTHVDRTWIVTCRGRREGGESDWPAERRAEFLAAAIRGTGAWVDVERAAWRESESVRSTLQAALATTDDGSPRLILSAHDFHGTPSTLPEPPDRESAIDKRAYAARDIRDSFPALDRMHECRESCTTIAMGEPGRWTRVLARKLGAFNAYAALDRGATTAPGQLTLAEMINLYRWHDMDQETGVYGVIGDPVAHSLSPTLMNHWLQRHGINAVYLPLRVAGNNSVLSDFIDGCRKRPWLDTRGFSVTLPHKSHALACAGDGADWLARNIGAANTLCLRNGEIRAYNTDCYAAVDSMLAALNLSRTEIRGLPVAVLGTGGSARAVLAGLSLFGCRLHVFGRSASTTRELAGAFSAEARDWADRDRHGAEVIINCTSLGMWPDVDRSPMSAGSFTGCRLVFDLIYRPARTKLLADARQAGCKTLNGLDMFIRQATAQFELWTGTTPDMESGRATVERALTDA